jgi:hypothetical protein
MEITCGIVARDSRECRIYSENNKMKGKNGT